VGVGEGCFFNHQQGSCKTRGGEKDPSLPIEAEREVCRDLTNMSSNRRGKKKSPYNHVKARNGGSRNRKTRQEIGEKVRTNVNREVGEIVNLLRGEELKKKGAWREPGNAGRGRPGLKMKKNV